MGTTLTGTTPQDTYDSLIKVTDNGPISGTAKFLSDGLGNDSALALSTSLVGIGTAVPTSKLHIAAPDALSSWDSALPFVNVTNLDQSNGQGFALLARGGALDANCNIFEVQDYSANSKFVVKGLGNVGIGTSAPNAKLQVNVSNATASVRIKGGLNEVTSIGQINSQLDFAGNDASVFEDDNLCGRIAAVNESSNGANVGLAFSTYTQPTFSEKMRITSTGVVELTQGQIKFPATQVASADANTLDDYEEGTFTATLKGSTTDPTTPVTTTGTYTKIGRQVSVSIQFANVTTTGAAGAVTITGVPFSCATAGIGAVVTELFTFGATRTSVSSLLDSSATTTIRLLVSGNDTGFEGLTHTAGAGRYLYTSLTYFV